MCESVVLIIKKISNKKHQICNDIFHRKKGVDCMKKSGTTGSNLWIAGILKMNTEKGRCAL